MYFLSHRRFPHCIQELLPNILLHHLFCFGRISFSPKGLPFPCTFCQAKADQFQWVEKNTTWLRLFNFSSIQRATLIPCRSRLTEPTINAILTIFASLFNLMCIKYLLEPLHNDDTNFFCLLWNAHQN